MRGADECLLEKKKELRIFLGHGGVVCHGEVLCCTALPKRPEVPPAPPPCSFAFKGVSSPSFLVVDRIGS